MTSFLRFQLFAISLALSAAVPAFGQETSPDEAAIHDSAVKFVDAYNAKDAAAITALFDAKARLEEADGTVFEGAEAIREAFAAAFAGDPDGQIGLSLDSLTMLTPDVAVEQGETEFYPDGETLTASGRYIAVHLKKDGAWRMISARSLEKEVLSNYEYLRQLEWLAGDWIDEDADEIVETSFRWEDGRNFLIQEYQVKRGSEVVLKGSQRMGWDPLTKQIRGWIFDSEGGYGDARWVKADDSWIMTVSGVTSDGVGYGSTRTLVPLGERVDVRISNRVMDGASQPDLDFTMVRRPPVAATAAAP